MNKKINLVVVLFVSLFVFAACGQATDTTDSNSGQELTFVDDADREVTYTTDKIVADYYIGELLYLDANLVGANLTYASEIWPEDKLSKVQDVGSSLEEIANLEPTLIITLNKDLIEQYEVIAPTIYIEYGKDKPMDLMKKFGTILNKEEEMEKVVDNFDKRVEDLKSEIDKPDYTYTIVQEFEGAPTLYGANWGRGGFILYDYLGLKGTEKGEEDYIHKTDSYLTMASESLLDYIGDVVIIFADMDVDGYEDNALTENPLFKDTEAFKNKHVYYIDDSYMYDDPYSVEYLLDYYEDMLSGEDL